MDFSPSSDQELVLEAVAGLAHRVAHLASTLDETNRGGAEEKAQVAELGLLGVFLSESEGGAGFGVATGLLALEKLAEGCGALALRTAAHAAHAVPMSVAAGADSSWVEALVAGEHWASVVDGLRAEAGAVHGEARWVVGATDADLFVLRTEDGDVFTCPPSAAGLTVTEAESLGMRGAGLGHVRLDGVRAERLGPHQGGAALMRAAWASVGAGVGRASLAAARAYALERKQFGRPIADFQAIQWMLADAATALDGGALLCLRAGLLLDEGAPADEAALSALLIISEAALGAAQKAIQVHGGYGFVKEFPVERLARDARYFGIALGGRAELQRELGTSLLSPQG